MNRVLSVGTPFVRSVQRTKIEFLSAPPSQVRPGERVPLASVGFGGDLFEKGLVNFHTSEQPLQTSTITPLRPASSLRPPPISKKKNKQKKNFFKWELVV